MITSTVTSSVFSIKIQIFPKFWYIVDLQNLVTIKIKIDLRDLILGSKCRKVKVPNCPISGVKVCQGIQNVYILCGDLDHPHRAYENL